MAGSVARLSRVFQSNDVLQLLQVALKSKGYFAYDADAARSWVSCKEEERQVAFGSWQAGADSVQLMTNGLLMI